MNIPSNRLDRVFSAHKHEYEEKALAVLNSAQYILGEELQTFEHNFAEFHQTKHCIGVACGLDALWIALHLLGIDKGDEVIVQGNTFIATALACTKIDAVPVFADVKDNFCIDSEDVRRKITSKTKAIIITHLYGLVTPMDPILSICAEHNLKLIEDCAQAHGAAYRGQRVGSFGDAGCFSFYPTKNLGGFGDGGAITTNNDELDHSARIFRNYGNIQKNKNIMAGTNSRLDELQAGLLNIRLKYLSQINAEKAVIADRYYQEITNPLIRLPVPEPHTQPVWHQYVIRCKQRDKLRTYLAEKGIGTDIHYPTPPHKALSYLHGNNACCFLPETEKLSETILSLPIFPGLTDDEQAYIINILNLFQ